MTNPFRTLISIVVVFCILTIIIVPNQAQTCPLQQHMDMIGSNINIDQAVNDLPFTSTAMQTFLNLTSTYKHHFQQPQVKIAKEIFAQINQQYELDDPTQFSQLFSTHSPLLTNTTKAALTRDRIFQILQEGSDDGSSSLPQGTVREFMGAADQGVDSESVCVRVIPHNTPIFVFEGLNAITQQMISSSLYALISLANPIPLEGNQYACDMTVFTYFCNFVYPPAITVPIGDPATPVPLPLLPCKSSYRGVFIENACPELSAAGILDSADFAWGPDDLCNTALLPAPRFIADETQPQGYTTSMPIYTCPLPFVTVDKTSYPYSTIMNGYCAMQCPTPLRTKEEMIKMDKIFVGFSIPSTIMGMFLVISYLAFQPLRERVFIVVAVCSVQYQGWWLAIPTWHRIAVHGWGSGQGTACSLTNAVIGPDGSLLSATPFHQTNFVCAMTGIAGIFGMYSSLGAVVSLGFALVQRVCLGIQLTKENQKLQQNILLAFCFVVPTIFSIVVLGYDQFQGGGASCSISKRIDSTGGPNLADGIGIIPAVVYVCVAYIELFWVIGYLAWVKLKVKDGTALTWAQIRIILLIIVMSSLYLAIFTFRLMIEYNYMAPMTASIGQWLMCTLTTAGGQDVVTQTCGATPTSYPANWSYYLTYIAGSPGFTIFFAIGFSFDILYCYARFFYQKYRWEWLEPYAKRSPRGSQAKSSHHDLVRPVSSKHDSKSAHSGTNNNAPSPVTKPTLFKKSAMHPVAQQERATRATRTDSLHEDFGSTVSVTSHSSQQSFGVFGMSSQNNGLAEIELGALDSPRLRDSSPSPNLKETINEEDTDDLQSQHQNVFVAENDSE